MGFKEKIIKNKEHIIVIFLLAILVLSVHYKYINTNKAMSGDSSAGTLDILEFIKQSILTYHQFPHWYPTVQGGTVFWAHPHFNAVYYTTILELISQKSELTVNFSQLLNTFLAGLFMYFVMIKMRLKPAFAFISAIAYMFSVYTNWMVFSYFFRISAVTFLPLIFYFTWNAFYSKEWIKYAIYSGIMLAIQFLSGGADIAFFIILVFVAMFCVYIVGKGIVKRLIKSILVSIFILIVFLGLFSIKMFPMMEYDRYVMTKAGTTYEEGIGTRIKIGGFKDFVFTFIAPKGFPKETSMPHQNTAKIGIIVILLMIFSLYKIKERKVMFFLVLAALSLVVATGSNFYYLFWKFVPGFNKLHHVYRASFLFVFASAALAGIGLSSLSEKIEYKFKFTKKTRRILYFVVLLLALIDILVVTSYNDGRPWEDFQKMLKDNKMMQYIKEDKDIFRINNINTKNHAGSAALYSTYLGLEILYGGYAIWYPEFYTYLGISHSYPAKFYGMLNTKYIYSNSEVNVSGLSFLRKFPECEECWEDPITDAGIDGPYLYLNDMYLPRAHFVDHSILIVGNKEAVMQTAYGIMINDNFNPANSVVIMGDKGLINNYDIEFLKRFDAILLTADSIDGDSGYILKQYVDSGGTLLPNLINGTNTITVQEIDNLLASFKGDYTKVKKVNVSLYTPNKREMDLKGQRGFLVTAEKYFWFEGWKARINNNKNIEILRANGMNSAVYLDGEAGKIAFEYKPRSFKIGMSISLTTLIFIILYFSYRFWKRNFRNEK